MEWQGKSLSQREEKLLLHPRLRKDFPFCSLADKFQTRIFFLILGSFWSFRWFSLSWVSMGEIEAAPRLFSHFVHRFSSLYSFTYMLYAFVARVSVFVEMRKLCVRKKRLAHSIKYLRGFQAKHLRSFSLTMYPSANEDFVVIHVNSQIEAKCDHKSFFFQTGHWSLRLNCNSTP